MSIYYKLITDDVPNEKENTIGDNVDALSAELEKKCGAKLVLINSPIDEALNEYFINHNLQPLNEK